MLLWVVLWVYTAPVDLFRLPLRSLSVSRPSKCQTLDTFDAFDQIPSWLKGNCKKLGFITPTEVQTRALPVRPYKHGVFKSFQLTFSSCIFSAHLCWQGCGRASTHGQR